MEKIPYGTKIRGNGRYILHPPVNGGRIIKFNGLLRNRGRNTELKQEGCKDCFHALKLLEIT